MKKPVIAVAGVATALFLASGAAVAADLVCTSFSTGGTWHNVVVPAGAFCTLNNSRVTGNVTVKEGGSLQVTAISGDTTIAGDIKGDGCDSINLDGTGPSGRIVIGGNLTIQNVTFTGFSGATGNPSCPPSPPQNVLIGGNVKCDNVAGGCSFSYVIISGNLECSGNANGCGLASAAVGQNASINNNGSTTIVDNSEIGGDLKCSGNFGGVGGATNTIAGTKSGQCSGL